MSGYLCGLGVGLCLCTVLGMGLRRYHPVLNVGQSLPGAVYACRALTPEETLTPGTVVYYRPPARVAATLRRIAPQADLRLGWLKQVAALGGDVVCWDAGSVRVNEQVRGALPLLDDYALTVPSACQVLGKDEVLPMGTAVRSFDGRYSGPLKREEIQDICTVLF